MKEGLGVNFLNKDTLKNFYFSLRYFFTALSKSDMCFLSWFFLYFLNFLLTNPLRNKQRNKNNKQQQQLRNKQTTTNQQTYLPTP